MHKKHIEGIRAFNRYYTDIIGLLDEHILNSKYSLPEARILYELYHHEPLTSSDIINNLQIDKGYLSRLLRQFEKKKLLDKKKSPQDGRSVFLRLTAHGKKEFESLNKASDNQLKNLLEHLDAGDCDKLLQHMTAIKAIFNKTQHTKQG